MTSKEFSKNEPSDDTHVLHVTLEECALIEAVMEFLLSSAPVFAKDAVLSGMIKNISKKCKKSRTALRSQEKRMIKND